MIYYGQSQILVNIHAFSMALSIVYLFPVCPSFNGTIYGPIFQDVDLFPLIVL